MYFSFYQVYKMRFNLIADKAYIEITRIDSLQTSVFTHTRGHTKLHSAVAFNEICQMSRWCFIFFPSIMRSVCFKL